MQFETALYRSGTEGREQLGRQIAGLLLEDVAAVDEAVRTFESDVLHDPSTDYQAWVEVFGTAFTELLPLEHASSEALAFCVIQSINGTRRMTDKDDVANLVPHMIERAWVFLDDLVETDLVLRLRELANYHEAQFADVVGDFRRAALTHARSGDYARARGDELSMALSQFSQAAATVRHYIAADDSDEASTALADLMDGVQAVERAFAGRIDPEARRWLDLNLPWNVITLHFLAGDHISTFPEYVERLISYGRDFPEQHTTHFAHVRVGEMVQLWAGSMDITQMGPIWHGVDAALRFYKDMDIPMPVEAFGVAHILLSMRGDIEMAQIAAHLSQVMDLPESARDIRTYARGHAEEQGVSGLL